MCNKQYSVNGSETKWATAEPRFAPYVKAATHTDLKAQHQVGENPSLADNLHVAFSSALTRAT